MAVEVVVYTLSCILLFVTVLVVAAPNTGAALVQLVPSEVSIFPDVVATA